MKCNKNTNGGIDMKEEILKQITDYYLNSGDFNGTPYYHFDCDVKSDICELIDDGKAEIISARFEINPHIKRLKERLTKEEQKKEIVEHSRNTVIYPTAKHLKALKISEEKPFTKMLTEGKAQLEIVFFNIEVLEMYYQNPKYIISSSDYRGYIVTSDEFCDELDSEYLKDFGLGYRKALGNSERVIGAFIGDLAELSLNAQLKWKIYLLDNQSDYVINEGFYKNTILNQWVDDVSVFDALLEEMIVINNMCERMEIPHLFNKTIKPHSQSKPEDYRIILLPTMKNYYAFVQVLEKLVVHNINYKTFTTDSNYINGIDRKDENGNLKGSLIMFSEWLKANMKTSENLDEIIFNPLRNIRKIRQVPAHEMYSNKYDKSLHEKQNDLIVDIYSAIRGIRLFFSNYIGNSNVEVPDYLITGEKIVVY